MVKLALGKRDLSLLLLLLLLLLHARVAESLRTVGGWC
jgi:hypothetical protein